MILTVACSPAALDTPIPPISPPDMPTPTERPTSDPPDVPPEILAPEDQAITTASFPDFQFTSPPRAWTVNIVMFNPGGFRAEYIYGVGAGLSGWMDTMFQPVTPAPLPPGTYQWYAFGCRQTAVGGCGPHSPTRTFTITG